MWGTQLFSGYNQPPHRFIPTHVGNTGRPLTMAIWSTVHPHACGEHECSQYCSCSVDGSSPRMWGTRTDGEHPWQGRGFIPTHVGNTPSSRRNRRLLAVHPHACGEHDGTAMNEVKGAGSSPRMWGTLAIAQGKKHVKRFIPTHVGNTSQASEQASPEPVHPHACGEHGNIVRNIGTKVGSSPRMWGTRG